MIKRLLTSLLLLTLISPSVWADVSARVDKSEIVIGEAINLTISTSEMNGQAPDLKPLDQSFTITGMQQSSEITLINGKRSSSRNWTVTLEPKNTTAKSIIIPAITLDNEKTTPITIKIIDTPTNLTLNGHDILKIETSLAQNTAYIQQQLLFTIRIYIDQQQERRLRINQLISAPLTDFETHELGRNNYEREINGRLYNIIELRYVLSPQKSGTLTIAPYSLAATVLENNVVKNKTITSDSLTIDVKPIPANYPKNAPWLPAEKVILTESWNKTPSNVQQGDTLVRTLTIQAEGLTSNQIGNIVFPTASGIKVYPEKPVLNDKWESTSPIGTRIEKSVIIPVETGDIIIPKTKLPWWNTKTNTLEYAELPEQTLHVEANPAFNNPAPVDNNAINNAQANPTPTNTMEAPTDSNLWLWQLATTILAITTLIGFGLWLHARKQPAIIKADSPIINPKTLLGDIKSACQANNPQLARTALDNWVKQQPENLTDLFDRHPPLAKAVDMLNKALYSEADVNWQGSALWEAIQSLPPITSTTQTTSIPPLYPK